MVLLIFRAHRTTASAPVGVAAEWLVGEAAYGLQQHVTRLWRASIVRRHALGHLGLHLTRPPAA